jgi:hypothetical protein
MPSRSATFSGATFSKDRRYRYRLWRAWGDPELRCVFVGLNPSTADESNDDPTIRKCVGFAKRWGFGAVDVVNLFAFRSTEPMALLAAEDPVGRDNGYHLSLALKHAKRIVWAWGSHGTRIQRLILSQAASVRATRRLCKVGTLGIAKDASPRHPLMLAYATAFKADDDEPPSAHGASPTPSRCAVPGGGRRRDRPFHEANLDGLRGATPLRMRQR